MSRRYFLKGHSSFKIASSPSLQSCTSASLGTSCPFSCRLESLKLGFLALAGYTTRALSLSANWILGCLSVNFSILFMFMGFVVAPSCGAEDFWHNQCIWEDGCIVHLIGAKHPQKNSLVKIYFFADDILTHCHLKEKGINKMCKWCHPGNTFVTKRTSAHKVMNLSFSFCIIGALQAHGLH
jgi:hypothetical protein